MTTRPEAEVRAVNIRHNARLLTDVTLDELETLTEYETATLANLVAIAAERVRLARERNPERLDDHGGWYLHRNHVNADVPDPDNLAIRDRVLELLAADEDGLSKSQRLRVATYVARDNVYDDVSSGELWQAIDRAIDDGIHEEV